MVSGEGVVLRKEFNKDLPTTPFSLFHVKKKTICPKKNRENLPLTAAVSLLECKTGKNKQTRTGELLTPSDQRYLAGGCPYQKKGENGEGGE